MTLPLFDEGLPLEEAQPDAVHHINTAALQLNRARHGAAVERNREHARARAVAAAEALQPYLGTKVSRAATLALVAHVIEQRAAALDSTVA